MSVKSSFSDIINGPKPVLIDFSAEWCGPCKAMTPIVKEVAREVGNKVKILKIDVDKHRILSNNLEIRGVPTFILYNKGKMIWRQSGMQSARTLKEVIESALGD